MSHRRLCLAYVVLMLVALTIHGPQSRAATAGTQENISNSSQHSEAPQAALAGSTIHVVWGERETATIATNQKANGATWAAPTLLNTGTKTAQQWSDTAVTFDGAAYKTHIVYAAGDKIFHRSKPSNGGAWSDARFVASDSFPNPVRMVAAPNGTLWIVWRDANGTAIRYRRSGDGGLNWSGGDVATQAGNMFAPDIAVGPDNQPHIVWYLRTVNPNGGVRTADWNGSSWSLGNAGGGYDADPVVVVDKDNTQHVAYRKQNGSDWIIQHMSRAAGQGWSAPVNVRTTTGDAAYAPGVATDSKGGVHVSWSELNGGGGRDVWYSLRQAGKPFSTPINVSENPSGWNSRSTVVVTEDAAGIAAHIFYQRGVRGIDVDDIYYRRFTNVYPAPPLTGSLTINGGAHVTNKSQVTVSITNTSTTAVATSYSIADGGDPGAPNLPFANPSATTTFTLTGSDGHCRPHTLYAKLGNQTGQSAAFSGTIIYDALVDAIVQARNPNLPSNPVLNDFNALALPSGDIAYTRRQNYNLGVHDSIYECSGLKRYALAKHGEAPEPAAWHDIPAEGYVSRQVNFTPNLPNGGQGRYQFDVYVEDRIGNVSTSPHVVSVVYDVTAPALGGVSGPLATTSSPKGGVVSLNTAGITVDDNLYTEPGSGRKYWGYWVLVKKDSAGAPREDQELNEWAKYGVVQPGPVSNAFSWNMARGLVGGIPGFTPGTHTVYIRYLDGAGNWSSTITSQSVQVNQLELFQWLPSIQR